ncbi:MAG: AAA family ATPase [Thermodesulfobacteriota bacterium]
MTDPQELDRAMRDAAFYPHPVEGITVRETHISRVYLTGRYVYKIKKPVDLGFLNFTTLSGRRHYCRREIMLNRRLAPDIYLDILPVTFQSGRYSLEGSGDIVEYAVRMQQLPETDSMTALLDSGGMTDAHVDALAGCLADFHRLPTTAAAMAKFGGPDHIGRIWRETFDQTALFIENSEDRRRHDIIRSAVVCFMNRRQTFFLDRVRGQRIRDGHGDLRCEHIYFHDGIRIIDCIEFNPGFRLGDTANDLAFLIMDLDFRGHDHWARRLLAAYVEKSGDAGLVPLIDFYKCYRAMVRFKVSEIRRREPSLTTQQRSTLKQDSGRFLLLAYRYALQFTRPTMWVLCGLPASGKSTLARALADLLRIDLLQSDRVRKDMFPARTTAARETPFAGGIYTPEADRLTYGNLLLAAQEALEKNESVILDATFRRRHFRDEAGRLARDLDANFILVECRAGDDEIRRRLKQREESPGLSDARLAHFEALKDDFDPVTEIDAGRHMVAETDQPLESTLKQIMIHDAAILEEWGRRRLAEAEKGG